MPFSARQGFFKTTAAPSGPAYPDWPTQANVSQYNTEVALYSGTRGTFTTDTFGKTYVSNSYRGSVRHPNGNIYFLPRSQTNVFEYDPSTDTATQISVSGTGSDNYTGGALGRNGNIYLAPFSASDVLEFDPRTRTSRSITITGGVSGSNKYNGGVTTTSGNVVMIPQNETEFIEVDCTVTPATAKTKSFGVGTSELGGAKYISGTVHPNGNIYLAPLQSDSFMEIDPVNDAFTKYAIPSASTSQLLAQGAVTGADGNIWMMPYNSGYHATLDPDTGTVTKPTITGVTAPTTNGYIGGTAAPDGNIYYAPFNTGDIITFDPVTLTGTKIATGVGGSDRFVGAASDLANVYFVPNSAGTVGILPTGASGGTNANAYTLSSFVNSGH